MSDSKSFSQMVVVGASAGGIEALTRLVQTLPQDFSAPLIVAQHLDPSRESHLGDILAHSSTLPVRTPAAHERLEPGVVYVVPANRDVEITDHEIRLTAGTHRSKPSIDHLFASAAQVFGEELFAVVLTGTGSDGAAGALEVRQAGGTVIVQDPLTASFPELPRSLPPSAVDFVVPLEEIGPLLHNLLAGTQTLEGDTEERLDLLLRVLRDRHGVDFRSYKRATIMRRVQRRLAATNTPDIVEYLRYLQQHPEEEQALIASFLIKVTKFFRDPDLFELLRERILPAIVEAGRKNEMSIRVWSAGCATGEEAYSLAILLAEVLGDELEQFHVRIFATDLDADAIAFARQGIYPSGSLTGVERSIVDRYFDSVDGSYQISKRVRALMVFGQHDLADRAPFPRVDLVLCRNVLIYFTPELQRRILQLFAFSLRDGGFLILGKSETASPFAEAFVADDTRLKVYLRRGIRSVIPTGPMRETMPAVPTRIFPTRSAIYGRNLAARPPSAPEHAIGLRADSVLFDLPLGVVVVDRRYDIQYINELARLLLGIHGSALGEDLIHLVQTVQAAELRGLIDRTLADGGPASATIETVDASADTTRHLHVVCKVGAGNQAEQRVMIGVLDTTDAAEERLRLEEGITQAGVAQEHAAQQRRQLADIDSQLLSANQQLTREMAELRSQNEEFLVGNEELQAATEEVETLNEELQATNEELETLNEELQATVEELNTTNDDLQTRNVEVQDMAERLETARARGQAVLNTLGDAIAVVDERGSTVLTTHRYEQVLGAPLERLEVLKADGSAMADGDHPHLRAARGERFESTHRITLPNGDRRLFTITGQPVQGDVAAGGVLTIREASELTQPGPG